MVNSNCSGQRIAQASKRKPIVLEVAFATAITAIATIVWLKNCFTLDETLCQIRYIITKLND